jgi:hypothetical protein
VSSATVPSPINRSAAANANPDPVHPPERTDAVTLSRNRAGGTMKPSVKPGATFLEGLSMTIQESGASAVSGGSLSRNP